MRGLNINCGLEIYIFYFFNQTFDFYLLILKQTDFYNSFITNKSYLGDDFSLINIRVDYVCCKRMNCLWGKTVNTRMLCICLILLEKYLEIIHNNAICFITLFIFVGLLIKVKVKCCFSIRR